MLSFGRRIIFVMEIESKFSIRVRWYDDIDGIPTSHNAIGKNFLGREMHDKHIYFRRRDFSFISENGALEGNPTSRRANPTEQGEWHYNDCYFRFVHRYVNVSRREE